MLTAKETQEIARNYTLAIDNLTEQAKADHWIMGHAKYFGSKDGEDTFLIGTSTKYLSCYYHKWITVNAETGAVTEVEKGKVF